MSHTIVLNVCLNSEVVMADGTREQILDAAGPVFADQGYDATIREICAAATVNVAAVNYYFGDKQNLYLETVRRAYQLRTSQVPMPSWSEDATPAEKLVGYIHTLVTRLVGLDEAPWPTRLLTREVIAPTAVCRELVEEYFRPTLERLLAILDEIVPDSITLAQRQQLAFSITGQCMLYRVAGGVVTMLVKPEEIEKHFQIDQIAHHIATVSLAALGLTPAWQEQIQLEPGQGSAHQRTSNT